MPERFCINCKHAQVPLNGDVYKMTCGSPRSTIPYIDRGKFLVSGIEQPEIQAALGSTCATLRRNQYHPMMSDILLCGEAGAWFEEK